MKKLDKSDAVGPHRVEWRGTCQERSKLAITHCVVLTRERLIRIPMDIEEQVWRILKTYSIRRGPVNADCNRKSFHGPLFGSD